MTKLLSQYFRCTALGIQYLWFYSCSLIAWPKLSCVYCTGKATGWFFRHEMSDLFELRFTGMCYVPNTTYTQVLMHNYLLLHCVELPH